jgi:hypothetical protein
MQKHKFGVMCPSVHFVESVPVPPEHKKWCVDAVQSGYTVMHYVTRISHWIQKHKFGAMCPDTHFMESVPGPLEFEK